MRFREITPADARDVAALVVRCDATVSDWTPGFRLPEDHAERELAIWEEDIASEDFWSEVAMDGDTIVGVVAGGPSDGHIMGLFVEPSLHGQGLGAVLLGHGESRMRELGHVEATVNVLEGSPAVRFYERNGWAPNGRRHRFVPFDMATIGYAKTL